MASSKKVGARPTTRHRLGGTVAGRPGRGMNTLTSELERICDVLELRRAEINGEFLTGYLPEGAAVELSATALSLQFARRVAVAATDDDAPTGALEWFIRRLNRLETTMRWEIRRRDRPRGIETWLVTKLDRDKCSDATEPIRGASTNVAQLADKQRRTIQAICEQSVATRLQRYLSASTSAGNIK